MSLTVLVVDDEPIARHAVIRLLRDDADIEIVGIVVTQVFVGFGDKV